METSVFKVRSHISFMCRQKCNCKIFLGNIGNAYKF
nr:MAG TPA: hypothetical protein [Caudoviricetes sp.]